MCSPFLHERKTRVGGIWRLSNICYSLEIACSLIIALNCTRQHKTETAVIRTWRVILYRFRNNIYRSLFGIMTTNLTRYKKTYTGTIHVSLISVSAMKRLSNKCLMYWIL